MNSNKHIVCKKFFSKRTKSFTSNTDLLLRTKTVEILRIIKETSEKVRFTDVFLHNIISRIVLLQKDIEKFVKIKKKFPYTSYLNNLLRYYIILEYKILCRRCNDKKSVEEIQNRILYILNKIFKDPNENDSVLSKTKKAILGVLLSARKNVGNEFTKKLIEKTLERTNVLEELQQNLCNKRTFVSRLPCNLKINHLINLSACDSDSENFDEEVEENDEEVMDDNVLPYAISVVCGGDTKLLQSQTDPYVKNEDDLQPQILPYIKNEEIDLNDWQEQDGTGKIINILENVLISPKKEDIQDENKQSRSGKCKRNLSNSYIQTSSLEHTDIIEESTEGCNKTQIAEENMFQDSKEVNLSGHLMKKKQVGNGKLVKTNYKEAKSSSTEEEIKEADNQLQEEDVNNKLKVIPFLDQENNQNEEICIKKKHNLQIVTDDVTLNGSFSSLLDVNVNNFKSTKFSQIEETALQSFETAKNDKAECGARNSEEANNKYIGTSSNVYQANSTNLILNEDNFLGEIEPISIEETLETENNNGFNCVEETKQRTFSDKEETFFSDLNTNLNSTNLEKNQDNIPIFTPDGKPSTSNNEAILLHFEIEETTESDSTKFEEKDLESKKVDTSTTEDMALQLKEVEIAQYGEATGFEEEILQPDLKVCGEEENNQDSTKDGKVSTIHNEGIAECFNQTEQTIQDEVGNDIEKGRLEVNLNSDENEENNQNFIENEKLSSSNLKENVVHSEEIDKIVLNEAGTGFEEKNAKFEYEDVSTCKSKDMLENFEKIEKITPNGNDFEEKILESNLNLHANQENNSNMKGISEHFEEEQRTTENETRLKFEEKNMSANINHEDNDVQKPNTSSSEKIVANFIEVERATQNGGTIEFEKNIQLDLQLDENEKIAVHLEKVERTKPNGQITEIKKDLSESVLNLRNEENSQHFTKDERPSTSSEEEVVIQLDEVERPIQNQNTSEFEEEVIESDLIFGESEENDQNFIDAEKLCTADSGKTVECFEENNSPKQNGECIKYEEKNLEIEIEEQFTLQDEKLNSSNTVEIVETAEMVKEKDEDSTFEEENLEPQLKNSIEEINFIKAAALQENNFFLENSFSASNVDCQENLDNNEECQQIIEIREKYTIADPESKDQGGSETEDLFNSKEIIRSEETILYPEESASHTIQSLGTSPLVHCEIMESAENVSKIDEENITTTIQSNNMKLMQTNFIQETESINFEEMKNIKEALPADANEENAQDSRKVPILLENIPFYEFEEANEGKIETILEESSIQCPEPKQLARTFELTTNFKDLSKEIVTIRGDEVIGELKEDSEIKYGTDECRKIAVDPKSTAVGANEESKTSITNTFSNEETEVFAMKVTDNLLGNIVDCFDELHLKEAEVFPEVDLATKENDTHIQYSEIEQSDSETLIIPPDSLDFSFGTVEEIIQNIADTTPTEDDIKLFITDTTIEVETKIIQCEEKQNIEICSEDFVVDVSNIPLPMVKIPNEKLVIKDKEEPLETGMNLSYQKVQEVEGGTEKTNENQVSKQSEEIEKQIKKYDQEIVEREEQNVLCKLKKENIDKNEVRRTDSSEEKLRTNETIKTSHVICQDSTEAIKVNNNEMNLEKNTKEKLYKDELQLKKHRHSSQKTTDQEKGSKSRKESDHKSREERKKDKHINVEKQEKDNPKKERKEKSKSIENNEKKDSHHRSKDKKEKSSKSGENNKHDRKERDRSKDTRKIDSSSSSNPETSAKHSSKSSKKQRDSSGSKSEIKNCSSGNSLNNSQKSGKPTEAPVTNKDSKTNEESAGKSSLNEECRGSTTSNKENGRESSSKEKSERKSTSNEESKRKSRSKHESRKKSSSNKEDRKEPTSNGENKEKSTSNEESRRKSSSNHESRSKSSSNKEDKKEPILSRENKENTTSNEESIRKSFSNEENRSESPSNKKSKRKSSSINEHRREQTSNGGETNEKSISNGESRKKSISSEESRNGSTSNEKNKKKSSSNKENKREPSSNPESKVKSTSNEKSTRKSTSNKECRREPTSNEKKEKESRSKSTSNEENRKSSEVSETHRKKSEKSSSEGHCKKKSESKEKIKQKSSREIEIIGLVGKESEDRNKIVEPMNSKPKKENGQREKNGEDHKETNLPKNKNLKFSQSKEIKDGRKSISDDKTLNTVNQSTSKKKEELLIEKEDVITKTNAIENLNKKKNEKKEIISTSKNKETKPKNESSHSRSKEKKIKTNHSSFKSEEKEKQKSGNVKEKRKVSDTTNEEEANSCKKKKLESADINPVRSSKHTTHMKDKLEKTALKKENKICVQNIQSFPNNKNKDDLNLPQRKQEIDSKNKKIKLEQDEREKRNEKGKVFKNPHPDSGDVEDFKQVKTDISFDEGKFLGCEQFNQYQDFGDCQENRLGKIDGKGEPLLDGSILRSFSNQINSNTVINKFSIQDFESIIDQNLNQIKQTEPPENTSPSSDSYQSNSNLFASNHPSPSEFSEEFRNNNYNVLEDEKVNVEKLSEFLNNSLAELNNLMATKTIKEDKILPDNLIKRTVEERNQKKPKDVDSAINDAIKELIDLQSNEASSSFPLENVGTSKESVWREEEICDIKNGCSEGNNAVCKRRQSLECISDGELIESDDMENYLSTSTVTSNVEKADLKRSYSKMSQNYDPTTDSKRKPICSVKPFVCPTNSSTEFNYPKEYNGESTKQNMNAYLNSKPHIKPPSDSYGYRSVYDCLPMGTRKYREECLERNPRKQGRYKNGGSSYRRRNRTYR